MFMVIITIIAFFVDDHNKGRPKWAFNNVSINILVGLLWFIVIPIRFIYKIIN